MGLILLPWDDHLSPGARAALARLRREGNLAPTSMPPVQEQSAGLEHDPIHRLSERQVRSGAVEGVCSERGVYRLQPSSDDSALSPLGAVHNRPQRRVRFRLLRFHLL
jgi:hypothetical protein